MRATILALIDRKLMVANNQDLLCTPSPEEIERVVLNFPKGKSPGCDGVTYDFL